MGGEGRGGERGEEREREGKEEGREKRQFDFCVSVLGSALQENSFGSSHDAGTAGKTVLLRAGCQMHRTWRAAVSWPGAELGEPFTTCAPTELWGPWMGPGVGNQAGLPSSRSYDCAFQECSRGCQDLPRSSTPAGPGTRHCRLSAQGSSPQPTRPLSWTGGRRLHPCLFP